MRDKQPSPHNRRPQKTPMKVVKHRRRRRLLKGGLRQFIRDWGKR